MNENERYIKDRAFVMSLIKYILLTAVVLALVFFATRVISVLIPFLIGFLLAKTSHAIALPFSKLGRKKSNTRKKLKRIELTVYALLMIIIAFIAVYAVGSLFAQGAKAFSAIQDYAVNLSSSDIDGASLQKLAESNGGFIKDSMIETVTDYAGEIQRYFFSQLPGILTRTVSSVWSLIGNIPYAIFVVISVILSGYYFISDGPAVMRGYLKSVPNKSFRRSSLDLINTLSLTLFRALGGYLLLLIITWVESWVTFLLAGVEYAMVLALITAVLDFMPVLGISATMVPVMIYCFIHGNYTGIAIIIIAMAIMTVIRRIIEPPIVGKTMHLHPLWMLISMALGVFIWGAVGFLMGPVVFIIIVEICKVFGLDRKFMPFFSRILERFMKPEDEDAPAAE